MSASSRVRTGALALAVAGGLVASTGTAVAEDMPSGGMDGASFMSSLPSSLMMQMMQMMPNIPTAPIGAVVNVAETFGLGDVPPVIFAGMYAEVNEAREAAGLPALKPCPFATNHAMSDAKARVEGGSYEYPAMGGFKVLTYQGKAETAGTILKQWLTTPEGIAAVEAEATMQGVGVARANDGSIIVILAIH